ncbi:hypothetical protein F5J12DRAFT_779977 [Pisolithus orientalis]|uniref:uncharacterized protein n=1 Tax=Pisolithus orientalis TaxID=936130 RepID=UPI0022243727|nr:uncharacterized protein F5J12DRAFT_779977 [Pisolithus orientalis]KAI6030969.1 hypothetical protein F5J12DRAFT_779977 [Pisolithus orientalis]
MTSGKHVSRGRLKGESPRIVPRGAVWKEKSRVTLEGLGIHVRVEEFNSRGSWTRKDNEMGIQNSKKPNCGKKSVFEVREIWNKTLKLHTEHTQIVTLKNYIVQGK